MTPLIQWASKICSVDKKYDLTNFQWFDATNAMQEYFHSNIPVDVLSEIVSPMPFKQMFICMSIKNNKAIIRIEEKEEEYGLLCTVAALGQDALGNPKQLGAFAIIKKDGQASFTKLNEEKTSDDDVRNLSTTLAVFQSRLKYQTIQVYQPYIKPTYTNQRLIKKGKPPAFEWRTVVVEPSVSSTSSKGGTHASPRLHDRRGHWRTMKKSGKRVWVRQCKVGDASKGVIYHDYKFNQSFNQGVQP